jgi:hypothetical protein
LFPLQANVPIPAQLPASACPSQTPTRSLVRFEDGTVGAFPQPQKLSIQLHFCLNGIVKIKLITQTPASNSPTPPAIRLPSWGSASAFPPARPLELWATNTNC